MKMAEGDTCPHCGKNLNYAGQPLHLPAGFVVSGRHPYVLGAALGQGGFGITYIALDMVTNTRVAIKEYFPTHCSGRTGNNMVTAYQNQADVFRKGKQRFLEEAKTLKSLTDLPHIVNVLDFFEANNSAYLVMEFLEGVSLKNYVTRKGRFPAKKFLNQIRPLMEDIHRMHERGVIHRDIAPDNIMLLPNGQMKLIDFGAARSYVGGKSMTMVVKRGFAPVEQYLSHGSTASTDVYALAATIYYCITGRIPPDSADREYAGIALAAPISLGADLTSQQEKAILKAMKVQQKERPQTVREFLDALHQKRRPFLFLTSRGKKLLLLILAAVAAILILVGIYYLAAREDTVQGSSAPSAPASDSASPVPQQTEGEEKPTTEPAETNASGNSSKDKPSSGGSPSDSGSSGSGSSGSGSSGSGSSGGNSSGGGSSGSGSSGGNSSGGGSSGGGSSGGGSSGGGSSDSGSSGGGPSSRPPADSPTDSGSSDGSFPDSDSPGDSSSGDGSSDSGSSGDGSSDSGSSDSGSSGDGSSDSGSSGSGSSDSGSSGSGPSDSGSSGSGSFGSGSFDDLFPGGSSSGGWPSGGSSSSL